MNQLRNLALLGASVAVAFMASCGRTAAKSDPTPVATSQAPPALTPSRDTGAGVDLRAAAEPFEVLTETAFRAPVAALDVSVRKAQSSAQSVRALLPATSTKPFDAHLAALDSAHAKGDRANIALSSIEVYRDLVSAVPYGGKVPNAVNLLDYAGFRYDADLKAAPSRWADMTQAVSFADENWALISPRVADANLATKVGAELAAMKRAAADRNRLAAQKSAKGELDLVDQLETYFTAR